MVRNIFSKTAGAALACAASIGLVAGCSTDGDAVKSDAGSAASTTTQSDADPAKVRALVLTPKDFPAGYVAQEIPLSQMDDTLDKLRAATKGATFTPASCGDVNAIPDIDFGKIGLAVATKGMTASLTEMVTVGGTTVSNYRKQVTGECSSMTMTKEMEGQKVTSRVKQNVLDTPKVDADDSIVVEAVTTTKVGGQTVETRTLTGAAEVDGYLINVTATNMVPSGDPDRAGFEALFTKAVAKVVDQA